jgi:predicted TPR repeat methyltransferase
MRPRVAPEFFERLYAAEQDPWGFETSAYERAKYDATIAALRGHPVESALEIGCSIGVLTARLAERAAHVLAVDVSEAALRTARARGIPNATFERRELPEEMPAGPFGLVVASEVLYYLDAPALDAMLEAIAGALAPRGSLLAVHWRHPTETYPLLGDEVHARLERRFGAPAHSAPTADYVLDRFDA